MRDKYNKHLYLQQTYSPSLGNCSARHSRQISSLTQADPTIQILMHLWLIPEHTLDSNLSTYKVMSHYCSLGKYGSTKKDSAIQKKVIKYFHILVFHCL